MVAALSWAARLKNGLARTREVLNTPVSELFVRRRVDESLFEDLETALLQADCGVPATQWLLTALRDKARVYIESAAPAAPGEHWRELKRARAGQVSYQLFEWRGDDQGGVSGNI